ncbi:insulinase family protein [bacterium]|nr:insulinase family protein [bacterium]
MYSYNNKPYLDNFRHNIANTEIAENKVSVSGSAMGNSEKAEVVDIPKVTPDYNVSLPMGYTKLGVEKLYNGQEIHCYKLNNGQKVYIAPKESAMTVLNTYVNTGSMNEKDDERGISHFCEHMAFNGTKGTNGYLKLGIGDVFRKVGNMGGATNASTNFAETNYTISIPQFNKDDFETIVKMQSSMMNNLEMSDEMTEKEHGPVTSEINMYSDMPDSIAVNAAIKNLYNIQTTSDDVVAGTVDNILNVDSKKVMEYYKNNYYPSNMATVVTGDVNPDEAIEIIAKNFKGENPQNPDRRIENFNPTQKAVRKDILSPKAISTSGAICFDGPANNDAKGNLEIEALNYFLFNRKNSKSNKALRPYHVEVSAMKDKMRTQPADGTLLTLSFNTTEDNSEITLKSVFNTLSNFKAPTKEEMETIKTGLKMKYEQKIEDTDGLNYMIGQNALNGGIDICTDAIDIIDKMTPEDLVNAVHKYYDTSKASIAIVHPEKTDINKLNENHAKAQSISFTGSVQQQSKVKKPIKTEELEQFKLANNCSVVIKDSNNDIAAFSAYVSSVQPANTKPGVMEVLEEMLVKGSDSIVDFVDKNNIEAYSGASNSNMYYEAEFPAKNLSASLAIMKKSLLNPDFTEADFEKAKKDIKTDLSTKQPSAYENLKKELFKDSPKGYSKQDILNNIDNIKLEDIRGLHKYLLDNGAFTISVSAPVKKYPQIKTVLQNELNTLPNFKENTPRVFNDFVPVENSKVITDVANTAQADVVQAYKFKANQTPKNIVVSKLMNGILSSGDETGLFNNLREKEKLAYSVYSDVSFSNTSSGVLTCRILTTTDSDDLKSYDNVQKSINGFTRQINKVVNGEFSDKELEAAKVNFKRNLLTSTDTQIDTVTTLSDGMRSVNGMDETNKMYELIDTITKEDIQKMAKEIFENKPLYSVKASQATLDANRTFFEELTK